MRRRDLLLSALGMAVSNILPWPQLRDGDAPEGSWDFSFPCGVGDKIAHLSFAYPAGGPMHWSVRLQRADGRIDAYGGTLPVAAWAEAWAAHSMGAIVHLHEGRAYFRLALRTPRRYAS